MRKELPESGTEWPMLRETMLEYAGGDAQWREGKLGVYIFHSGEEVMDVAHEAYGLFIAENGLGPAAFPSLKRMESEVIQMALRLQNAPEEAHGFMTSGGTESILLAIKSCRDRAMSLGHTPGTQKSGGMNIVAPQSVHPAFDKGAHLMGLEVIRVPVGDDFCADVGAMAAAVNDDTVMLVGSAPCFPYGVIDPIQELSDIAQERNLWLHVDACVGGYINPFIDRATGAPMRSHDFAIEGVCSMSLDLHKYGYAAKGASTVLYRTRELADHQVFDFDAWPCGRMYTPTFAGTRPGGAIAAAWGVMNFLGMEGYVERAGEIIATRQKLVSGVEALGLQVFGDPVSSIVTFGWEGGDILAVGEGLYESGWFSSRVANPDGIQLMISPEHSKIIDNYLNLLEKLVQEVSTGQRVRRAGKVSYSG